MFPCCPACRRASTVRRIVLVLFTPLKAPWQVQKERLQACVFASITRLSHRCLYYSLFFSFCFVPVCLSVARHDVKEFQDSCSKPFPSDVSVCVELVCALLFCDAKVEVEDAAIPEMKTFLERVSVKLYLTQTRWFLLHPTDQSTAGPSCDLNNPLNSPDLNESANSRRQCLAL